jgi:Flp pilus assembly protein TadD/predicted aspartyl protease
MVFSALMRRCLMIALVLMASLGCHPAHAVSCNIVPVHTPTPAESAYLHGDFEHAATLFQEQLQQNPNDPALTVGLSKALLSQQKIKEADDLLQKVLAIHPDSVALKTALGELQYREGTPWLAGATASEASKLDPCYARAHLLAARIYRINSFYASASREIATAHKLDPHDPRIHLQWLYTLPVKQRMEDLESYLANDTGDDPEDLKRLRLYLGYLKKQSDEPHKACHLVSETAATTIPFARIMLDATRVRAYGLDVKLNDHNARLQIDTGAGGLVVSRSVANRAGLKEFSRSTAAGVGDKGDKSSYTAYADDIKIGGLEFRDCEVEVVDQRNVVDTDGLIGMDVFSRFLVTLDYPMRNLVLGPLPPRPDETASVKPTLQTSADEDATEDPESDSPGGIAKTAAKATPRGPYDRYIAPEMKTWTPVYRIGHSLIVPASLNGSSNKLFILDTGAFATTISPGVAREVTKVHSDSNIRVKGVSGEVDKVYTAEKITFRFANLSQEVHDVVSIDLSGISKNEGTEISGLIGITALGQTTMTIDYRDNLVHFSYDANRGNKY